MATLGNDILITTSDGTIYATKSCDIATDCETIETAKEAQWRTFLAGLKSWAFSTSYLVGESEGQLKTDLLKTGQTVTVTVFRRGSSTDKVSGTAIITQCHITATRGSLAQGAFSFQGSGALS